MLTVKPLGNMADDQLGETPQLDDMSVCARSFARVPGTFPGAAVDDQGFQQHPQSLDVGLPDCLDPNVAVPPGLQSGSAEHGGAVTSRITQSELLGRLARRYGGLSAERVSVHIRP